MADLDTRFGRLWVKLGFERDWPLILVAALIGLVMSGVAMAFILPLRSIESAAATVARDEPHLLWWIVLLLPAFGALLAGLVQHLIPAGRAGPGVTAVMYAIYRGQSRLPWLLGVRKWLASTLTIGSGGSAGAEGPIVTIGSVVGSNAGRLIGGSPQSTAALLGCGAAAGMASVFNAPIAGVFFVMEILLRDFSLRTFTPIVIASVVSSAATQAVLGNDALFSGTIDIAAFEQSFTWREVPNYLVLGVVCGLASAAFILSLGYAGSVFRAAPVHPILKPALGALLIGALGALYLATTGGRSIPEFYGNGYPVITALITPGRYYLDDSCTVLAPASDLLAGLAILAVAKALATCLTIGSGGAGGLFAPSLMLGAAIGGGFGYVVNALGWFPSATPAHYALVGMAAMVAATAHAPLTGILMVYEITRNYEVILPLMLAAVISTIVARLVYRESAYTARLTEMGVRVGGPGDLSILRRLTVEDVPLLAPVFVRADDSAQRLLELSERMSVSDFVVVDRADRYVALVTGSDLKEALVYREAIPLLHVHELERTDLPTVRPDETLDVVLDKFARHDVNSLAVVGDGTVVGLITRSRLMRRYQAALDRD